MNHTDTLGHNAPCTWSALDLLPHAGDAVLLDDVRSWDDHHLEARVAQVFSPLYRLEDGSLPSWVGLEIMAQAVAAWAGCQARSQGRPVEIGFLLGTRRYDCAVEQFLARRPLAVRVQPALHDATGISIFEARLFNDDTGHTLAHARLNVYRPANIQAYLQEPPLVP